MADEQEIDIKINTDGTVQIDMIGFKGEACDSVFKKLSRTIGEVTQNTKKSDYYESDAKVRLTEEE